ncbi:hypothetical protein LDENG_00057020 [Lucifuga dentata]|nr:hypothetical protein LDENG_00057020 [Lucifuga dentata]
MGGIKLCLLLLLGTSTLAQQDSEGSPLCSLSKKFKNFRRFVYDYEAEIFNGVNGGSEVKSGPKVSCKVEIDVPQACSFILRTTECSLTEISHMEEDTPVYRPAAGAKAFQAAMAKNPLNFIIEGQTEVKLSSGDDEPSILNVKRGIVSAFIVPVVEAERNEEMVPMVTVHGVCDTDLTVNTWNDIATDVTLNRDLSRCDRFSAQREQSSPLALISGMHYPLSKLISSTQTCNYKFDNQKKHMTSGICTEKHIFLPFSRQNEYGISTLVKQTLTLRETSKINDRIFDLDNFRYLPMETAEIKAKSPVQTKDAVIATIQELSTLSQTFDRENRASLFHKLVSELRVLNADILRPAALEMMQISSSLTWQALVQCGTPECSSAMLSILRTFETDALEVDAVVYALGLMPTPSRLLVKDMLEMAQYKQSKPIMYALSNAVKKLYLSEGEVTPEIAAVSEYMASLLGADCAGEKELTYLTLRVVGNMGDVMEAADPAIKTTLLKCMRQPATTLSVQMAAIQAFRRMSVTDEVRSNLQRVSQYPKGAIQKRLAAYLSLMRNPKDTDIEMVKKLILSEQNMQVKAFVTSHIYNIISSTDPELQKFSRKIMDALQDDVITHTDYTTMSRNYKLGVSSEGMQANIQGNIIFDPTTQMPREALLETTLKAFGYNLDIWEVGIEGKGFESTIDALFGKNGFFPDTVSKSLYWAEDKMPINIKEVLEKYTAPLKSEGQKVPENLVTEIMKNFNKLIRDLQSQDSQEAMAYLRIMGNELGYIKGSDLKFIADYTKMYGEVLLKLIPKSVMSKLLSGTDNEIFAHYIFMENKFTLSTASGFPLKFSLSGIFVPGAKGGLRFTPNMQEVSFMPSVGIAFVTQMGVHVPEFVDSAVEMHTNMYHESAFNAKVTWERNQIKLSIPAPQGTMKLLKVSNKVMILGVGRAEATPKGYILGDSSCNRLFSGVQYCTTTYQPDPRDDAAAPYFPLTGEASYSLAIKPTRRVSEYTATIAYELLNEGKDGRQKVDALKMILRAEGDQPSEATATMKYNRNRNVFTTQMQIPDIDVETSIRIGVSDSSARGKSVTLELSNNNIPQLSLIGRAKLRAMTGSILQVQLLVPSLNTDATITATMNNDDVLTLELKSDVKLPQTSSIQAVTFKYGEEQAEVQLMSNMNADTTILVPYTEALQAWLGQFVEDVMDQQVVKTDMKLRHIFTKALEASNNWMDKFTADVPYVEILRNGMAEVSLPSMPDNLFMNMESTFKYQFNQDRMTITLPLPLGGKSSEELRIPPMLTTPPMSVSVIGLHLPSKQIPIPTFTIPTEYDLSLPLIGMVEVSTKVNSNYYNWEGMVLAGNNTSETPSYLAKFKVTADSPIKLLSFTSEGAAEITDTPQETIKYTIDGSLTHKLMEISFSVMESAAISDKVMTTGNYKVNTFSPLGLRSSLVMTSQCSLASDMLTVDSNMDGSLSVGSMSGSTTYSQSFSVEPMKKEARWISTMRMDSAVLTAMNKVKALYADEQLLIESDTNINNNPIKHTTKFSMSYKDAQLTVQSDSVTKANERMVRSQVDVTASLAQASIRIENQAGDTENRVYSLLSGSMTPSGMEINSDASLNIFSSHASHKGTLVLNMDGLTTSCTTTAQSSPITFKNVFNGGVDASGATMSLTTKGTIKENTAELGVEGKILTSEVYLNGVFKGNLFDIDTRNRVNLRLNEDGLTFSNNMVGSFNEIKTANTHTLRLTLRSLALQSKTNNILNERNSYMHDIMVNMEGFTASVTVENNLKIMGANFMNNAKFEAKPYKMELIGTMMGVLSEEELKHTYEVMFVDMKLSAKCNTNGKLLGSQVTHATDMEVSDWTMQFNSAANVNSPSLHLGSTLKIIAAPLLLNIDAIVNSDGSVYLFGQQSGELYSKLFLKAEPMQLLHSFEYRVSTAHELENGASVKTNMDNRFNTMMSLREQSVTLRMASKVNNHAIDQEMMAYNNAERMGIELKGVVSTDFFRGSSDDYLISGFVKYDKNSESHFIQIPFIEHLPALIEDVKMTVMRLVDYSTDMLKDIDSKYEISAKFYDKVSELKEVIDRFDFSLFAEDLKTFINSIENFMTDLTAKIPSEEIINVLKSIKEAIMAWIQKYDIAAKFNVMYVKVEEILSNYEIEKIIEAIMDGTVNIMKQYQVREWIQSAISTLRSIDIEPLFQKMMVPVKELMDQISAFDLKQLIEDVRMYLIQMTEKIMSFDYDTFAMELKEKVTEMSSIPCFGKLHGEFKVSSHHYKLLTTASLENTTTTSATPEFTMNLNSQATSTLKILDHTLDARANFAVPKMSRVSVAENIKLVHSSLTLDHEGTLTIYGLSAQGSAKTAGKVTTEPYEAELVNDAFLAMENGVSATAETIYKHNINMPLFNIFNEAAMNQKAVFRIDDGTASLNINNLANGKYAIQDYSDEVNHKSDMEVTMDFHTTKVSFTGATGCTHITMNQNMDADICIFRHVLIDAKAETETPFVKSVAEAKVQAKLEDLKFDLTASHSAELVGSEGTLSNSALALVSPNELMFDTKNRANAKLTLPFKLSGKIDFQNDISLTLNSEVNQASWTGLARFNQYKYSHSFTVDNDEREIKILAQMNGEANLDVLKERVTIPEIIVPFVGMKTPKVEDFSLWEDTVLSSLLTTTQQTFDMNSKLKYMKNPDVITIDINMEPMINLLNSNIRFLHKNMAIGKDKAVAILATSYDKLSKDMPKTITVPAYKVPMMNVEVTSFTIPLPDFSFITMNAPDVPAAFNKLKIPRISLPKIQSIKIPIIGDLTYEFSMKTAMITLKTDASIVNQDDIIIRLDASSTSEFEVLTGKIEGTTTMNRVNGLKMASILSAKHMMVEANHDSTVSISKVVDASIANSAKINLPELMIELNQEMFVNPQEGLIVSVSSPSAGLIAVQLQTKQPAQIKGRLYGRYPSEPTKDIDVLAVKMSVMNSEKLNVQTTWNMEMPYEMMLEMKERVPTVIKTVSVSVKKTYNEITKVAGNLKGPLDKVRKQGKMMFRRAADNFASADFSGMMTTVTDNTMLIVKHYQRNIEILLDAVIKFLRETTFLIPGYENRLTGLEVYQTFIAFVVDVTEEAFQKIPVYFASIFTEVIDHIRSIEFTVIGSNYIVSGREILDDLSVTIERLLSHVIATVKKLGAIQLEDIINKFREFMDFAADKSEKLLQILKSQNVEKISTWLNEAANDARSSSFMLELNRLVVKPLVIVVEYFFTMKEKLSFMFASMSMEQLQADIQTWIEILVKRFNAFQNNVIEFLKEKSKIVEPFVRVSDRQVGVDIPFPFVAKFN